jgi:hypothetical protein
MPTEISADWTTPPPDIRAEVIASMLIENGLELDKLLFETVGVFKRSFEADVVSIEEREVGRSVKKVMTLNREGIYDALPKDLFHLPTQTNPTTKKKVDEIKIQRLKEKKSREFFLPLEQEFYHQRVWVENKELQSFELGKYGNFIEILRRFWQIPDYLEKKHVLRLLPLIPTIAHFSGDILQMATYFSTLTNQKISIDYAPPKAFKIPYSAQLGDVSLGDDLILDGEITSYLPTLILTIQIQKESDLIDYLPNGSGLLLVNWLIEWFLPAENEVEINTELLADKAYFSLDDSKSYYSRLGYVSI